MVLAAILLILGGQGLYLVQGLGNFNETMVTRVCIVRGVFVYLFSQRQSYTKSLIAYLSMAPASFVIIAIFMADHILG